MPDNGDNSFDKIFIKAVITEEWSLLCNLMNTEEDHSSCDNAECDHLFQVMLNASIYVDSNQFLYFLLEKAKVYKAASFEQEIVGRLLKSVFDFECDIEKNNFLLNKKLLIQLMNLLDFSKIPLFSQFYTFIFPLKNEEPLPSVVIKTFFLLIEKYGALNPVSSVVSRITTILSPVFFQLSKKEDFLIDSEFERYFLNFFTSKETHFSFYFFCLNKKESDLIVTVDTFSEFLVKKITQQIDQRGGVDIHNPDPSLFALLTFKFLILLTEPINDRAMFEELLLRWKKSPSIHALKTNEEVLDGKPVMNRFSNWCVQYFDQVILPDRDFIASL